MTIADKALGAAKAQLAKVLDANWSEAWQMMEQAQARATARGTKLTAFKVPLSINIESRGGGDYHVEADFAAGYRVKDHTDGQTVSCHPDLFGGN